MKSILTILFAVALAYSAPAIRGIVRSESLVPVSGVLITLSTGQTITTGADGRYVLGVSSGWSGTVSPSQGGMAFRVSSTTGPSFTNVTDTVVCSFYAEPVVGFSGKLVNGSGNGVSGVIVYMSFVPFPDCPECCGPKVIDTTQSDGLYSLLLYPGWMGSLVLLKEGVVWQGSCVTNDVPQTANIINCNITGRPQMYVISGFVKYQPSGTPVANAIVTVAAGISDTTDATGSYGVQVPYGTTALVSPSKAGMRFLPVEYVVNTTLWEAAVSDNFDVWPPEWADRDTVVNFTAEDLVSVQPVVHAAARQPLSHVPSYDLLGKRSAQGNYANLSVNLKGVHISLRSEHEVRD